MKVSPGAGAGAEADTRATSRRARAITIGAVVTVLVLAVGWVALAFTGDTDGSSVDAVGESTLPGYPTRGAEANLDEQRGLMAAANVWREFDADEELQLPEGQIIELLWAGDVDSLKLEAPPLRSSFTAQLVILRSDNAVAALARPLDGAGSDDETAFSVLGVASIATSKYERGFTVSNGVHLFDERMEPGLTLETATFTVDELPELSETRTSDGLLLASWRSLFRVPDVGGSAIEAFEGFAYVHPNSGLNLLQTADADADWAAVTDRERGNARYGALTRGILTAHDEGNGARLRVSILDDQTLPSGAPLSLVEVAHLDASSRGAGLLWAVVVATRADEDAAVVGAGTVAAPRSGAPQLPVIAARWLRDDAVDVLVVAGSRDITGFEVVASGGTTRRDGSSGVVGRGELGLTWENADGSKVTRPALVVIGRSEAGPVQPLEPVS